MINFYIPNKKPGEKIILLVRRHIFILLIKLFFWIFLTLVPPLLYLMFRETESHLSAQEFFIPFLIVFLGAFYLTLWLFMLHTFIDYYLDVWIVTNERILNIEQKQLFHRVISEHDLSKIQDVTAETSGMFATFLNYGEVHIQTAGEMQRFVFQQVPNPLAIKRKITSLCEYKKRYEKVLNKNGLGV